MIAGGGYFEGSHGQCLIAGPFIHDSSQIPKGNCDTRIELQKFEIPSFSTEALYSRNNFSYEQIGGTKPPPSGSTMIWNKRLPQEKLQVGVLSFALSKINSAKNFKDKDEM
jgi:hypothetical protein